MSIRLRRDLERLRNDLASTREVQDSFISSMARKAVMERKESSSDQFTVEEILEDLAKYTTVTEKTRQAVMKIFEEIEQEEGKSDRRLIGGVKRAAERRPAQARKVYISLIASDKTSMKLRSWARSKGFDLSQNYYGDEIEDFDFHLTIVASVNEVDLPSDTDHTIKTIRAKASGFKVLGENTPVLSVGGRQLDVIRKFFVDTYGLEPTFKDFKPHVSLSYNWDGSPALSGLSLPTFPIEFDRMVVKAFKGSKDAALLGFEEKAPKRLVWYSGFPDPRARDGWNDGYWRLVGKGDKAPDDAGKRTALDAGKLDVNSLDKRDVRAMALAPSTRAGKSTLRAGTGNRQLSDSLRAAAKERAKKERISLRADRAERAERQPSASTREVEDRLLKLSESYRWTKLTSRQIDERARQGADNQGVTGKQREAFIASTRANIEKYEKIERQVEKYRLSKQFIADALELREQRRSGHAILSASDDQIVSMTLSRRRKQLMNSQHDNGPAKKPVAKKPKATRKVIADEVGEKIGGARRDTAKRSPKQILADAADKARAKQKNKVIKFGNANQRIVINSLPRNVSRVMYRGVTGRVGIEGDFDLDAALQDFVKSGDAFKTAVKQTQDLLRTSVGDGLTVYVVDADKQVGGNFYVYTTSLDHAKREIKFKAPPKNRLNEKEREALARRLQEGQPANTYYGNQFVNVSTDENGGIVVRDQERYGRSARVLATFDTLEQFFDANDEPIREAQRAAEKELERISERVLPVDDVLLGYGGKYSVPLFLSRKAPADLKEGVFTPEKRKRATGTEKPKPWETRYSVVDVGESEARYTNGRYVVRDNRRTRGGGLTSYGYKTREEAETVGRLRAFISAEYWISSDSKGQYVIFKRTGGGRSRVQVVDETFDSYEDAGRHLLENIEDIATQAAKKTGLGEEILAIDNPNMKRVGPSVRKGNITKPEQVLEAFGLRGVEFGNWQKDKERQVIVNHAFDAFQDLAWVMGVKPDQIGLGGDLGVGFGSRGRGGNARAHYEPNYAAINLTRTKGSGTLAHEWMHALDHYLRRKSDARYQGTSTDKGGNRIFDMAGDTAFLSMVNIRRGREDLPNDVAFALSDVVDKLRTKTVERPPNLDAAKKGIERVVSGMGSWIKSIRKDLERGRVTRSGSTPATPEQLEAYDKIIGDLFSDPNKNFARSYNYTSGRWTNEHLDALDELYKSVTGKSGMLRSQKGKVDALASWFGSADTAYRRLEEEQSAKKIVQSSKTDFYKEAAKLDEGRTKRYWTTDLELLARGFEAYVEDKLAAKKRRSDYLAFGADNSNYVSAKPYPEGSEREEINKAFDALFEAIRKSGVLKAVKTKQLANMPDLVFHDDEIEEKRLVWYRGFSDSRARDGWNDGYFREFPGGSEPDTDADGRRPFQIADLVGSTNDLSVIERRELAKLVRTRRGRSKVDREAIQGLQSELSGVSIRDERETSRRDRRTRKPANPKKPSQGRTSQAQSGKPSRGDKPNADRTVSDSLRSEERDVPERGQTRRVSADEARGDSEAAPSGNREGSRTRTRRNRAEGSKPDRSGSKPDVSGRGETGRGRAASGRRDRSDRDSVRKVVEAAERKEDAERAKRVKQNYRLSDADQVGEGGPKTKVRQNIEAIKLLNALDDESRSPTDDEKSVLAKYVGWGAFAQPIFDPRDAKYREWEKERKQVRELLNKDQFDAARASTTNAHFTSPDVVRGMWEAVKHLGFKRGKVLEPAVGSGNFIGFMPDDLRDKVDWSGVDLDITTSRIAKHLYPVADIRNAEYQSRDGTWPDGYFDMAISNVPFENVNISYKRRGETAKQLPLHDFYFLKSLDQVRPGGLVAFVTSRYTMDKLTPKIRQEIEKRGDFVGAIRLPGGSKGAFAGNAGTQVTTDIIFVRKRLPGDEPNRDHDWDKTVEINVPPDGEPIAINKYFADNPKMMLGEMHTERGQFTRADPVLIGDSKDLDKKIADLARREFQADIMPPRSTSGRPGKDADADVSQATDTSSPLAKTKEGGYYVGDDGKLYRKVVGVGQKPKISEAEAKKVRAFLPIRDAVNDLLDRQSRGEPTAEARALANEAYDAFVKKFDALNFSKTSVRTGKTGKEIATTRYKNRGAILEDPDVWKVLAIEAFDEKTGKAKKRSILQGDTVASYKRPEIKGPSDAIAVSLNERGVIDMPFIASLMGEKDVDKAAEKLGDAVFNDPTAGWQRADVYLSGDVKSKLEEAKQAAKSDKKFERNVKALEEAQPEPLTQDDIIIPLGASWLPKEDVEAFLREIYGISRYDSKFSVSLVPSTKRWVVKAPQRVSRSAQDEYGTEKLKMAQFMEYALNGTPAVIVDIERDPVTGNEIKVKNVEKTLKANQRLDALRSRFMGVIEDGVIVQEGWVYENQERADRLVARYNARFNRLRPFKADGSHLTLPGIGSHLTDSAGNRFPFELRKHQKDAVWRAVVQGNTLLDHAVGAGKTLTMIASAMEQKRLGLIKRPMVVVPDHMLEQFSREWLDAYPNAKILVADSNMTSAARRQEFLARSTSEDWDAIIIRHSSFSRLGMRDEAYQDYTREQIAELEDLIAEEIAEGARASSPSVKELEKMKKRLKVKLDKRLAKENKDEGLKFEELGVDQLIVDEAHLFKNLGVQTRHNRVKGIPTSDAQRATDLFLKIRHAEKSNPGRGAIFATGTPISNTMAEMFVLQKYLQPKVLKEYDIESFDSWASTFGIMTTQLELGVDGRTFRDVTSFSKFVNIPELVQLYGKVSDTVLSEDLPLKRPDMKGGKAKIVTAQLNESGEAYMKDLIARAEAISKGQVKDPRVDNMLKVLSEGRKLATDERLLDPSIDEVNPNGKIALAANNIFDVWKRGNGKDIPVEKSAQLVFLDLGTPGGKANRKIEVVDDRPTGEDRVQEALRQIREDAGDAATPDGEIDDEAEANMREESEFFSGAFNLYDALKDDLVKKGIPANQIAFIHDAKSDAAKGKLFSKVRSGEVRILLGSTSKMGVGTNVQERLYAMHHLDAPWRPSDVEQRDGRIIRQGNLHDEIEMYRYVTEKSTDAFIWQLVDRKKKFIDQVRNGTSGTRIAEDVDSGNIDTEQMKAAATGDPRFVEQADLTKEIRVLSAQLRAHERSQKTAIDDLKLEKQRRAMLTEALPKYEADAKSAYDTRGDKFRVTIKDPETREDREITNRKEFAEHMRDVAMAFAKRRGYFYQAEDVVVGQFGDIDVVMRMSRSDDGFEYSIRLKGQASYGGTISPFDGKELLDRRGQDVEYRAINEESDLSGSVRRAENLLAQIPAKVVVTKDDIKSVDLDLVKIERTAKGQPFPRQDRLNKAKERHAELTKILSASKQDVAEKKAISTVSHGSMAVDGYEAAIGSDARDPFPRLTGDDLKERVQSISRHLDKSTGARVSRASVRKILNMVADEIDRRGDEKGVHWRSGNYFRNARIGGERTWRRGHLVFREGDMSMSARQISDIAQSTNGKAELQGMITALNKPSATILRTTSKEEREAFRKRVVRVANREGIALDVDAGVQRSKRKKRLQTPAERLRNANRSMVDRDPDRRTVFDEPGQFQPSETAIRKAEYAAVDDLVLTYEKQGEAGVREALSKMSSKQLRDLGLRLHGRDQRRVEELIADVDRPTNMTNLDERLFSDSDRAIARTELGDIIVGGVRRRKVA